MTELEPHRPVFPARIVTVINQYRVVINRGSVDGIKKGMNLLVYGLSPEELKDPDTGESLGRLEIVRGVGAVIHVQERLATIASTKKTPPTKTIMRRRMSPLIAAGFGDEQETITGEPEELPFDEARVGDYSRPA